MPVSYAVTPEVLLKLKEPFGLLIEGSFSQTTNQLKQLVLEEKPEVVISVGDVVSRNLHKSRIKTDLAITDNRTLRKSIRPQMFKDAKIIQIENPQGFITIQALTAIQQALQNKTHTHLVVNGEEDLLALPAVIYAPENSFVIYGQPRKGLVVVKVTAQKREEARQIWAKMKQVNQD
jgi:GTP-dependent dephospho-CoA kinase